MVNEKGSRSQRLPDVLQLRFFWSVSANTDDGPFEKRSDAASLAHITAIRRECEIESRSKSQMAGLRCRSLSQPEGLLYSKFRRNPINDTLDAHLAQVVL